MLYLLSTSCVLTLAYSTLFPLGDNLLLLSSCRHEGVHSELPGVRGLLGVRLPVVVPVAPSFRRVFVSVLHFRILCFRHFVIHVINDIRTRFIISFYMICAVIYCSFYCIYVWFDPGTYMIARFMSFYKPSVTLSPSHSSPINSFHTYHFICEEAPPLCIISLGSVWGRSAEKSRTCWRFFGFVPLRIRYGWSTYPGSSIRWVLVKLFFCSYSFVGWSSVLVADTLEESPW